MSQSAISSSANKNICNALGCLAEATEKIQVKIGLDATITLDLCNNCVSKFADN
jgi:hypothetical protein